MNRPFTWGDANQAMPRDDLAGAASSAQCALCGIARPLGLLVPDGGQACADIRWYCKDSKSCTERWVAARPPRRAHVPATPGTTLAGAGEPARDEAAAERLDGLAEAEPAI